jgi:imidazole glycerol-phosphate synthase subunit HisH
MMIAVIDYHMGNLGSIINMFNRVGAEAVLTNDITEILHADKLVLPGVGAFDKGMENLADLGLIEVLEEKVLTQKTPMLGLCLGMQLFTHGSDEGGRKGFGWIDGFSRRFSFDDPGLKVPHMGWNTIDVCQGHYIVDDLPLDSRYYFVHSFFVECQNEQDILAKSYYGIEFASAVVKGSIIGMQFHPEKSLRWGMEVFRRFANHG